MTHNWHLSIEIGSPSPPNLEETDSESLKQQDLDLLEVLQGNIEEHIISAHGNLNPFREPITQTSQYKVE